MICTMTFFNGGKREISPEIINEVVQIIKSVDLELGKYKSARLKDAFLSKLRDKNWSSEMRLDEISKISITSVKNYVGLCLQIGNVARTYADMLKLQTLYTNKHIKAGIIIVPVNRASKKLGINIASLERLARELEIFSSTITIPLAVIGFNN